MFNSGCTGHYLDALPKIFYTRESSGNPINVKLTNSFIMVSTHQAHIPLQNLSRQAKHAEIFPNLHFSLISIVKLCDYERIVTFDKHKFIVSKNKDIIIEGYWDQINGLWRFLLDRPSQNNKQANILEQITCNPIRPMAPQHPREYHPKYQQDLAIFTIISSAALKNTPCYKQSGMDTSQHDQESQRNSFQSISQNHGSRPKGTCTSIRNNQRQ